ncbi:MULTISPECIES: cupin domain-containing protein [Acinetobacter]|uniref:cupin domain-containing protein n=1 Tax=Acinetobacter TaxID=469 RepID=UPI00102E4088|nr:cupin domain-containing protein [Acinetobacter junii]RZG63728.1 cupin domain-containing protein [Acinetobacter junii]HEE6638014.1 cupin domain-containing protein [Acinetobacter baumannii]
MKKAAVLLTSIMLVSPLAIAHDIQDTGGKGEIVTPITAVQLPQTISTKATALRVDYAPGGYSGPHRHPKHVFAVVVKGAVEIGLNSGKTKIYHAGEGWYESPSDIHSISRNASLTEPATIVAWLLSEGNQELVVPEAKVNLTNGKP